MMRKAHIWQAGPLRKHVRWQSASGLGLEHLDIQADSGGVIMESVVIGDRFEACYGAHYQIRCAPDWSARQVRIQVMGDKTLNLFSDGLGNWTDGDGAPLAHLTGCLDIDISATPLTNTLPIRRLNLAERERRLIKVVYISLPALEVKTAEQAYTCLESGRLYHYEGLFTNFSTNLEVDHHGVVLDYPELFRRIRAD